MSPPPDPRAERAEDEDEPLAAGEGSIATLHAQGDVPGLLALARAHRSGNGAPRDLRRCLEAYQAAAALGDGDAAYAVALFHLSGGVVPQDLKEGAAMLRTAADRGNLQAKVYLGNLYELGVHYKADAEKADVWYRNAARSAAIEPEAEDFARAMAELGCVRYFLELDAAGALSPEESAALSLKARSHGYLLKLREEGERASTFDPLVDARLSALPAGPGASAAARPEGSSSPAVDPVPGDKPAPEGKPKRKPKPKGPGHARTGLAAFGYALLFMLAGVGAGYAAMRGAEVLIADGKTLPVLGTRAELALPILVAAVGMLPAVLVYRLGAVVKGAVVAAMFAGVGWVAWGTGEGALVAHRGAQTLAFAVAGFLSGLLVLGLMGGAKAPKAR